MNILITGANGQLGNEMRLVAQSSNDRYFFTDVNQAEGVETLYLDITDRDAIRKMVADNIVDIVAGLHQDSLSPGSFQRVCKLGDFIFVSNGIQRQFRPVVTLADVVADSG